MILDRNRFYTFIFAACILGYIWLCMALAYHPMDKSISVCLIKHTTTLPCPSCGSTRSILTMTQGDFKQALMINPMGYIVAIIMLIAPLWIAIDVLYKSNSMLVFYRKIEYYLRKPQFAFTLGLLVLINWIWNITKGY